MPGIRRMLVVGIVLLLAGLVWTFPARIAHHWFSPDVVQVAGISGSIWQGSAREASVSGVYLRNLRWQLRPSRLLLGKLAYRLEADPAGGFLETELQVGITRTLHLKDLNAALPIAALQSVLRTGDIRGDVTVKLGSATLVDGWPSELSGNIGVSGLLVRALSPSPLGNFSAEFQSADDGIVGSVEDVSGVLDVAATVNLNADRSYALIGQVGATQAAPASLAQQLQYLGSPDARGLRNFRLEGRL